MYRNNQFESVITEGCTIHLQDLVCVRFCSITELVGILNTQLLVEKPFYTRHVLLLHNHKDFARALSKADNWMRGDPGSGLGSVGVVP